MDTITEKTYKDTLIKKLLKEKPRAIEVANALLGTNFDEKSKFEAHELKDSLSARYNDISFNIDDMFIVLIEHQSTIDPNIAIRILIYFLKVLNSYYVKTSNLYSRKFYKMPTPVFYVLYNGEEPLKKDIIRFSEHFKVSHEFSIDLLVRVVDINRNSNNELLEKSPSLKGYSYLINLIREHIKKGASRDEAIRAALKECEDKKILNDFLKTNFEEVINMLNMEYDKELEIEVIRSESLEEGIEQGIEQGIERGIERILELINKGHSPEEAAVIARKI